MRIPKNSACYSCRGCHNSKTNPNFMPKSDVNCDNYLPAEPVNHFMDKIINDWRKQHGHKDTSN